MHGNTEKNSHVYRYASKNVHTHTCYMYVSIFKRGNSHVYRYARKKKSHVYRYALKKCACTYMLFMYVCIFKEGKFKCI